MGVERESRENNFLNQFFLLKDNICKTIAKKTVSKSYRGKKQSFFLITNDLA
jgi:hypothetical protein